MDALFETVRAASSLQSPPEIHGDLEALTELQRVERDDESFQIFSTELIYGEITAAGMVALFECLGKHVTQRSAGEGSECTTVFADLGSGNGFPALFAACRSVHPTFDEVIGIELQPRYHRNAIRNALLVNVSESCTTPLRDAHAMHANLTYVCGDFLDLRESSVPIAPWKSYTSAHALGRWSGGKFPGRCEVRHSGYGAGDEASPDQRVPCPLWAHADVVFCNGTWFDEGIIDNIVNFFVHGMGSDPIAKASRILALTSHELSRPDLEFLESLPLAASWNSDVQCYLYRIRA